LTSTDFTSASRVASAGHVRSQLMVVPRHKGSYEEKQSDVETISEVFAGVASGGFKTEGDRPTVSDLHEILPNARGSAGVGPVRNPLDGEDLPSLASMLDDVISG